MMAINTRAAAATAAKYIEEADNTNRDAPAVGASCWPGGISKDVITLANFIGSKIHILSLSLSLSLLCRALLFREIVSRTPPLQQHGVAHLLSLTYWSAAGQAQFLSLSLSLCACRKRMGARAASFEWAGQQQKLAVIPDPMLGGGGGGAGRRTESMRTSSSRSVGHSFRIMNYSTWERPDFNGILFLLLLSNRRTWSHHADNFPASDYREAYGGLRRCRVCVWWSCSGTQQQQQQLSGMAEEEANALSTWGHAGVHAA